MYLVNPEVVPVAEEVVVWHEAVQRPPDKVDPEGPIQGGNAEVLEVDVGKVAVVHGRELFLPARHISGEECLSESHTNREWVLWLTIPICNIV